MNEQFTQKTSNLLIHSFSVSNLSDSLTSLFKKEGMSKSLVFLQKTYIKCAKKYNFSQIFLSESLVFVSNVLSDLSESKQSLI